MFVPLCMEWYSLFIFYKPVFVTLLEVVLFSEKYKTLPTDSMRTSDQSVLHDMKLNTHNKICKKMSQKVADMHL